MSRTHLVIPDAHATPEESNRRAEWIGHLINDVKPDVVVNLGDGADMASLCSYDKNTKNFQGRSYKKDIECFHDFQDRLWAVVRRQKKRSPETVYLIGNHEQRIERACSIQPELEGTIDYGDLNLSEWYNKVVWYEGSTPGTIEIDGVVYAHYLVSGVSGRPISSENMGAALINRCYNSVTVGHNHTLDFAVRTRRAGNKILGLCAGVCQEHSPNFAGAAANLWWRGVIVKRNVSDGVYDPQFISLDSLKKEYS